MLTNKCKFCIYQRMNYVSSIYNLLNKITLSSSNGSCNLITQILLRNVNFSKPYHAFIKDREILE